MATITLSVRGSNGPSGIVGVVANLQRNGERAARDTAVFTSITSSGFAPVDTGRLKASHQVKKVGEGHYEMKVGAYYGIYVNFGTRHMAAQPFFSQTIPHSVDFLRHRVRGMLR